MKTAKQVDQLIIQLKNSGIPLSEVAWKTALACVGWPYVYGAVGEECKPAKRSQYGTKFYPENHTTIVTKCDAISWNATDNKCVVTGSCTGCKWDLPVRMFDCRGFTRKILAMVYSFTLWGGTVSGQWNDKRNWKAKGEIASMPKDTLCCLFVYKNSKWQHTGFGFNNETVECSSGVQHFKKRDSKWTHWGVPACIEGTIPEPADGDPGDGFPSTPVWRPTIRKGNKSQIVKELQTMLDKLGYNLGICGIDGDYGTATAKAVMEFQRDHDLVQDSVCGPMTWDALDKAIAQLEKEPVKKTYSVTIRGLDLAAAQEIAGKYPGNSEITEVKL